LFYTLEAIGALDKVHWKAMRAANVEGVALGSPGVLKGWLSKLGIDTAKFEEAQKSFSVQSKVTAARRMTQNYALSGTPLIVINGRVAVTASEKPERMLDAVNREIEAVRVATRLPAR
jgi:thiol:disulfide interchange protein DsbA